MSNVARGQVSNIGQLDDPRDSGQYFHHVYGLVETHRDGTYGGRVFMMMFVLEQERRELRSLTL